MYETCWSDHVSHILYLHVIISCINDYEQLHEEYALLHNMHTFLILMIIVTCPLNMPCCKAVLRSPYLMLAIAHTMRILDMLCCMMRHFYATKNVEIRGYSWWHTFYLTCYQWTFYVEKYHYYCECDLTPVHARYIIEMSLGSQNPSWVLNMQETV